MSINNTLSDIELFSKWKDKSKDLFTLHVPETLFLEYEYKHMSEQIERVITNEIIQKIKKEDGKELNEFDKLEKLIEDKQFENKVVNTVKDDSEKYANYYVFCYEYRGRIDVLLRFKANSIKSVIDHILNNVKIFREMFVAEELNDNFQFRILNMYSKSHFDTDHNSTPVKLKPDIRKDDVKEFRYQTLVSGLSGDLFNEHYLKRNQKFLDQFCLKLNNTEIIEEIIKYYKEYPNELLEEIYNNEDDYYLLNMKDNYLLLKLNDGLFSVDGTNNNFINCD